MRPPSVTLTGRPHSLRLDYYEAWGPAHCSLLWRPPGTREYEVIPPEALFHDRAAAEKAAVPARQSAPKATPAR